ncbi:MAG: Mor transcription activator family protein [Lachnospiraceae bacterium]|nr:Mor transcription activator family protein [Lachnospiraceae bacterium]MDE6251143.1 Mor transcription activator family protein [Lachnospiraceae bacterium]
MMDEKLLNKLIEDTTIEDISERYRAIVDIVGIRKFIELSNYARGDELYFPKVENVISPARNRRIKKEYNGYNEKELADRYNLTVKQIQHIMRDEPPAGQMSLEDWMNTEE